MSLYILNDNQKLIWDSMNKIPQFQMFGKDVPGQREDWFRDIIQKFYESNKFKLLSVSELQQLNRDTVAHMIQELKSQSYSTFSPNVGSFFDEGSTQMLSFPSNETERKAVTRDYIAEKKQEELNRVFGERQKEYGTMLTRGPVQDIDFRMEMESGPIENMDELVKRQMEYRDLELNAYKETQSSQNPLGIIENPLGIIENPLGVIDLGSATAEFVNQPKKTVHWSPPNRGILKTAEPRRDELQEFMRDIRNSVRAMQNELDVLKQSKEPIAPPEVLQNPNVSNILSRLRKPVTTNDLSHDLSQGMSQSLSHGLSQVLSQGLSQSLSHGFIDPTSRIVPRNQIYMEEFDAVNSAFT
jgi:hypothetical protein